MRMGQYERESIQVSMTDFLVKRDDLRECRIAESPASDLEPGQALLRVDTFGLTANNVTYAVFGEAMSYWDFFPAEDGWGRVPMWGFAEVERSGAEGVEPGTRVFGYLPPSSHLVVTPADAGEAGFVDGSPHRAALPSAYHRYLATAADPFYRSDTEEIQMLLRPLFFTSFLIDDQLDDEGLATRGPVLISSASSKTAIAAAFLLARREGVELVGLTSPRNVEFVAGLGVYDRTVAYDDVASLEREPATFVDIAGDGQVRLAVHSHFGDELVHSMAVGVTHWEDFGVDGGELPGPQPVFFFAPDRVSKRSGDWGRAGLEARVADAWHPFCEWTGGWLETIPGNGFDGLQAAYLDVLEGRVEPQRAHVVNLSAALR
jgi:NADPH:quinone reductase-like Zn-dependent oxidoreductase